MIERTDLRAAVGAGLLSEAQAASLTQLAETRRIAGSDLAPGDEPFELFRGFNEIFIVVGLIILTVGWVGVVVLGLGDLPNPRNTAMLYGPMGAAILWVLAEYFIRRRRMIAPAIALSVLFAGNALIALNAYFSEPFMLAQNDYSSLPLPMALTTGAVALFWLRFRVPFAMAMIALGAFAFALLIAAQSAGLPTSLADLFLFSADGPFALITLLLGVVVFIGAMAFDMSDPHRVTRRSANGFWLHLVAAPALVNTVALSLLGRDDTASTMLLLALLVGFALVAITIDRRSFLIAAIGYIVTLSALVFDENGAAITVLGLGVGLLLLGAFWERIRARLTRLVPAPLMRRLPPSVS